jgi:SAM-dependent methyltransferase
MGGFAVKLRHVLAPEELHLVDPWALDEDDEYTRSYGGQRTAMHSAYEQVRRVFGADIAAGRVTLHRDYSTRAAATFADHSFDLIYVDAMHDYENVLADLLAYKDKLKPDGFLLGHDFSNTHMSRAKKFGIIRAVREFVAREPFELVLITNEAAPSYLLARTGNETTLPALRSDLLNHKACSLIEVDEALLDQFQQVGVSYADGRKGQMIRLG